MTIKDLSFFQVKNRIKFLEDMRNIIVDYFNDTQLDYGGFNRSEGEKAQKLRSRINLSTNKLVKYISLSGVPTSIYYTPPPAIGGMVGNVDFIANLFNLDRFSITPNQVTDAIERSIGRYNDEITTALLRTINPLWWLFKLIKSVAYIPFYILQSVGVNTSKFEHTIFGKIIKLIFDLVVFLASLLAILTALGWQNSVISYFKNL